MNEYDIDEAYRAFKDHPVIGPAARYLRDYKDMVNSHSDGWCHWHTGANAAVSLQKIVEGARKERFGFPNSRGNTEAVTPQAVRRAIATIKAFCTKRNLPPPLDEQEYQAQIARQNRVLGKEEQSQMLEAFAKGDDASTVARAFDVPYERVVGVIRSATQQHLKL